MHVDGKWSYLFVSYHCYFSVLFLTYMYFIAFSGALPVCTQPLEHRSVLRQPQGIYNVERFSALWKEVVLRIQVCIAAHRHGNFSASLFPSYR